MRKLALALMVAVAPAGARAAIGTLVCGAAAVSNGGNSINVAYPTSPAAGDLLILFAMDVSCTSASFNQPATWSTLVNGGGTYTSRAIFYKAAAGGESGSVTVTSSPCDVEILRMCKLPGASTTLTAGASEDETTRAQSNAGVTPTVNGSAVFFVGTSEDCITNAETDGYGTPTGGTNLGAWTMFSYGTTTGADATLGIGYAVQTTAAATGAISSTMQASQTTYNGWSYTFAVAPTASGTTYPETVSEPVTLSDSLASTFTGSNSYSESTTLGETFASAFVGTNAQSETVTLADVMGLRSDDSVSEPVTLDASFTSTFIGPNAQSEAVVLDASFTSTFIGPNAPSEAVTLGDTMVDDYTPGAPESHTYNETVTEGVTTTDTLASAGGFANAMSEGVSAGDAAPGAVTFSNVVSEDVALDDSLVHGVLFANVMNDGISLDDSAVDEYVHGGQTYNETITESLGGSSEAVGGTLRRGGTLR